jgi:hypothetical protein
VQPPRLPASASPAGAPRRPSRTQRPPTLGNGLTQRPPLPPEACRASTDWSPYPPPWISTDGGGDQVLPRSAPNPCRCRRRVRLCPGLRLPTDPPRINLRWDPADRVSTLNGAALAEHSLVLLFGLRVGAQSPSKPLDPCVESPHPGRRQAIVAGARETVYIYPVRPTPSQGWIKCQLEARVVAASHSPFP